MPWTEKQSPLRRRGKVVLSEVPAKLVQIPNLILRVNLLLEALQTMVGHLQLTASLLQGDSRLRAASLRREVSPRREVRLPLGVSRLRAANLLLEDNLLREANHLQAIRRLQAVNLPLGVRLLQEVNLLQAVRVLLGDNPRREVSPLEASPPLGANLLRKANHPQAVRVLQAVRRLQAVRLLPEGNPHRVEHRLVVGNRLRGDKAAVGAHHQAGGIPKS